MVIGGFGYWTITRWECIEVSKGVGNKLIELQCQHDIFDMIFVCNDDHQMSFISELKDMRHFIQL